MRYAHQMLTGLLVAQMKNLPTMQETETWIDAWVNDPGEETSTSSSILVWEKSTGRGAWWAHMGAMGSRGAHGAPKN